jgi:hypothetical protein
LVIMMSMEQQLLPASSIWKPITPISLLISDRYAGLWISFKGIDFADDNGFTLIIA